MTDNNIKSDFDKQTNKNSTSASLSLCNRSSSKLKNNYFI